MLDFLKRLPYLAQIGIVTVVILLLAGGSYFFALRPMEKANQDDELTLKSKQAEVAQLTPYKAKLQELNAQAEMLKHQMEDQKRVVPEEKEVPGLITMVERESLAAGVQVRRYTPLANTTREYYVEVPFEIDVDGPYFAVVNFFDRLQRLERIVNVSKLVMGGLKTGGKTGAKRGYGWAANETVGASCVITTFYSTAKNPQAQAAKGVKR
jgi:type IV pilus assembly protein PilO